MRPFRYIGRYGKFRKWGKFILLTIFAFLAFAVILTGITVFFLVQYHAEIYAWFSKAVNFIFGDSTENVTRNIVKQVIDGFLKNLFTDK